MSKYILSVVLGAAVTLSACSDNTHSNQGQQQAPVVQQDSSNELLAAGVGAVAGYMAGKNNSANHPQIVQHHYNSAPVIRQTVIVRKTYRSKSARSYKSYRRR